MAFNEARVRSQFPILKTKVPSRNGRPNRLRYFDHAASTHPPLPVIDRVTEFVSTTYANVHRGNHHLSGKATDAFEEAREQLLRFIGGSPTEGTLLFSHNTTGALAAASELMAHVPGDVVVTHLEHHSNDLPHRRNAKVHRVDPHGDIASLPRRIEDVLRKNRVKLVAVTGASNVTGECPDLHKIARVAHENDARILVDAAQLLAHKPLNVKRPDASDHLDFVAAAGHKTYAPFGSSFLYGPRDLLDAADPILPGGGTVRLVTPDRVDFLRGPERHEAGTPNVVGAIAFAEATRWLAALGMDDVHEHEIRLAARLRKGLAKVPRLETFQVGGAPGRLGVAPFLLQGWNHAALATELDAGWGIATRDGCFCAQPLVGDLMGVAEAERIALSEGGVATSDMPGLVRASLGVYNNEEDVDTLVEALETLAARKPVAQVRANVVEVA